MSNANDSLPEPFVFSPSQSWAGNDGRWSTFILRVGTPEQNFGVLPATGSSEAVIPVPEGCTDSDPSHCGELRGAYPFDGNVSRGFQVEKSTTWQATGLYTLDLVNNLLGDGNNGLFGIDSVGLMLQNSAGLKLEGQVVAGIATKDFYLGVFGLGVKPVNFTNYDYPLKSFMQTLKDENKIPSLSYSYTAGAAYRIPQQYGSLTLGGYDASRYIANNQTFPFYQDDSKVLSVGVQKITAINTLQGTRSLLSDTIFSVIDSTVPHIWLPEAACDSFVQAFGLTYDNNTDLYLVNDTIHESLRELNPIITFSVGNDGDPEKWVSIALPYGAFDLEASHPIYPNATKYFPIRRAANNTQYTLGRTFLQEAYVITDHERSNFSISQARSESPMPAQEIVTITPPAKGGNVAGPSENNGLSTGAIVGIVVGIVALLAMLATLLFICLRRRRRHRRQNLDNTSAQTTLPPDAKPSIPFELRDDTKHEMGSTDVAQLPSPGSAPHLLSDDAQFVQKQTAGYMAHEMPADSGAWEPHEMGTETNYSELESNTESSRPQERGT